MAGWIIVSAVYHYSPSWVSADRTECQCVLPVYMYTRLMLWQCFALSELVIAYCIRYV